MASDMKKVTGEVQRVKHYSAESGFCVFSIRLEKYGKITAQTLNCKGVTDEPPAPGSVLEVYGELSNDAKYGPQMSFSAYHLVAGSSSHSVSQYLQSFAKYLGPEKAGAIARKFGNTLEDILDKDPERLMEVEGIGEVVYRNIMEGWTQNRSIHSIKIFLTSIGLKAYQIKAITAKHGSDYDALIKENPYVLMFENIGFSICDEIATRLNIAPDSPVRVKGIITNIIRKNTTAGEGHLCISKELLLSEVNAFNSEQSSSKKIDSVGVSWVDIEAPLMDLITQGFVVEDKGHYYLVDQFFYEAKSAEILAEILNTPGDPRLEKLDPDLQVDYYEKHEKLKIPDFKFSEKQSEAIKSFVRSKVLVVTGPPGTGKTTIIKTFVRILENAKASYKLLAPTGIASKRLELTSGKEAATIHRFLGYKGSEWSVNSNNPLSESFLIVDESSMVDMELFYRIISACKPTTHLVFVGDVHQLPSVGPGNVLKDIIKSGVVPTIELDKVHRQAEQSDIVLAANRIKDGDTNLDLFKADTKADICFVNTGKDVLAAEEYIKKICLSLESRKDLTYQVITPRNEGELSVESINGVLQEAINPVGSFKNEGTIDKVALSKDISVRPGDKVMVVKNNYNLSVFNGDVGKIRYITPETIRLDLNSGDSVAIPLASAREMLKLAYAATVHKVQGSEFSVCVIPLLKSHGRMLLQRNLIYTALTRARKKVFVVGQSHAIEAAIENAEIRNRRTLFSDRVQECVSEYEPNHSLYTRKLYSIGDSAENIKNVRLLLRGGRPQESVF